MATICNYMQLLRQFMLSHAILCSLCKWSMLLLFFSNSLLHNKHDKIIDLLRTLSNTVTVCAFGILTMVPLEFLQMVPLVANDIIGNQRTLNVYRQPMVPLVPMLPLVETLVPMVPLVAPMVPLVSPMVSIVI